MIRVYKFGIPRNPKNSSTTIENEMLVREQMFKSHLYYNKIIWDKI